MNAAPNPAPPAAPAHDHLRLELLRPHEIRAALAQSSVVYVPLGTIEWHGEHLPVGLDALTAHGVCLTAAEISGGLVYPPLYFGTGGDHGPYPWTVMMPSGAEIRELLRHLLDRLATFEVARVMLFSGHFAPGQLALINAIADEWNAAGSAMVVRAKGINMAEGLEIAPDHAGVFETTMLAALRPDCVDIEQLSALGAAGPLTDDVAAGRHDPVHPLWGVFGPDPRMFDPTMAPTLLGDTAAWLARAAMT